jgi:hypothetical protein
LRTVQKLDGLMEWSSLRKKYAPDGASGRNCLADPSESTLD